jgi:hypothetical protein
VRDLGNDLPPTVEAPDGRTFDVFISHASEDKDEIVRPLATALQSSGLSVWYDKFELRIGDSNANICLDFLRPQRGKVGRKRLGDDRNKRLRRYDQVREAKA